MSADEVRIPALKEHQIEPYEDAVRNKVLRCGRRAGKSVLALVMAVLGHGPVINGVRKWKGVTHGMDVVWVAPSERQLKALWADYIRKRFNGKVGVKLNEVDHEVRFFGNGTLYMQSAHTPEVIDNIRGKGANIGGIIFDEAAHFDLAYAWEDVAAPILLDHGGWSLFASTTNGGHDGNRDLIVPSYFNRLAETVEGGQKGPNWKAWYRTAFDNPKMDPVLIEELIGEYAGAGGRNGPKCQQEIFAKYIRGGSGLAFTEWDDALHAPQDCLKPEHLEGWRWIAGLDWGRNSNGALVLYAEGPKKRRVVRWDWYFKDKTAYDVGYEAGKLLQRFPRPEMIVFDDSMRALGGGQSIAQDVQQGITDALGNMTIPLVPCPKRGREGKTSRQTRKNLMHEALKVRKDGKGGVQDWGKPMTVFHPDAKNCIRTIPRLVLDEKDTEDVNTEQDDHAYDALTYPWLLAMPEVEQDKRTEPGDKHRFWGYDESMRKIDPFADPVPSGRGGRTWSPRGKATIVRGDD